MITVIVYGLDQFVVGDLSRDLTKNLAKIYEVDEDEVSFIAPNMMYFHKGNEQTSWNVLIHVHAPMKVRVLQQDAAKVLFSGVKGVGIHTAIEFYYYSQDDRIVKLDDSYPRFLSDENTVHTECEEDYRDRQEGEGEDEIFTGDIFKEPHSH